MSYELPQIIGYDEVVAIKGYKGIIYIPQCIKILGYLELIDCTAIGGFSDSAIILGSLNLQGSKVSRLPRDMFVGGSLNLTGTEVKTPPVKLTVKGAFHK